MTPVIKSLLTLGVGALIGAATLYGLQPSPSESGSEESAEKQPLYWVAPMDANYRRDKPGKSPMGMDLVPVYEEDNAGADHGPGAVTISPQVINNLGVRTEAVKSEVLHSAISTVGYVQYDEDSLVHIHPRVEGWIEKLFVKSAGDPVEQGAPLYTLYSPQLVNAQEEFLIALNRNNQGLIKAAKARLSALQLSSRFIENLSKNRQVQQSVTFYAPQSGVLDDLKIREGFFVSPGNTLMSIGQLAQVWVEAEIFERDAAVVRQGDNVSMSLDYIPGREWQGNVDYIYPSLNPQTRTLRVRLRFDNQDGQLKPNMYAQVLIHADAGTATLTVAKEAVIRTGKQNRVVLALGDGQFKSIEVKIGKVSGKSIEVLEGLNEDDIVVTSAQFLIDSESSKNSDFKRMSAESEPESVWMQGEVNAVMAGHRMVNITHEPAEAWGWPQMTMDFDVADTVDIDALVAGQTLHFEVTKEEGGSFLLTGIHIMASAGEKSVSAATVNGVINHIDTEARILNISRDAIEKWQRPAATMDFEVDEEVDIQALQQDMTVNFTFEIRDGNFVIVTIQALPDEEAASSHMQH